MSSRYFYKGTNIADLIQTTGNTTNSFGFNNFPQQNTGQTYISKINKPFDFMYKKNGEDIANSCNAYFLEYTGTSANVQGTTTTVTQSMNINNVGFKHISAYVWGGGGGGGGGGGAMNYYTKNGGTGRVGGDGGYAAVTNFKVNTSDIIVQYGRGGNGGGGGSKTASPDQNVSGPDGTAGGAGVRSYIALSDNTVIINAEGGNGGDGGEGGNAFSNGGAGNFAGTLGTSNGLVVDESTAANYTDNGQYVYSMPADATVWPMQNSGNNGNSGDGASWNGGASNAGNSGNVGYVGIYFLYQ
jgi:hypothetical protein